MHIKCTKHYKLTLYVICRTYIDVCSPSSGRGYLCIIVYLKVLLYSPLPKDGEYSPKHVGKIVFTDNWKYLFYFMCISWYT